MKYLITQNRQSVLVGPMFWSHRYFQSEIDDLEVDYTFSPTDPNSYIRINAELEVFPVSEISEPSHDSAYEQLVGPFWTFENNTASGHYTVTNKELSSIKSELKAIVANKRYIKEISGVKTVIQGTEVTIETDRETRNVFVQKLMLMGDNDTVNWKFPECWLTLTKTDLGACIYAGVMHIQGQFDAEVNIAGQLEAAVDIDSIKAIVVANPDYF